MKIRNIAFIFVALIVFSNGLSYMNWFATPFRNVVYVFFAFNIFSLIKELFVVKKNDRNFWLIIYLTLMPLFSATIAVCLDGQSIGEERKIIFFGLAFLSYFSFYLLRINEKEILYALFFFGLITLLIQLYQQLDSANILFGYNEEDLESGYFVKRNGIKRFFVGLSNVGLVCLYYFWAKILEKFSLHRFLLFLAFLLSMYLYLTRQVMIATACSLFLSFFIVHRRSMQKKAVAYIFIAAIVVLIIFDVAFANFISYSQNETYSIDVRSMAIPFFFSMWFDNFVSFLFGHGRLAIEEQWGLWGLNASDVGFIGEAFTYGIIWIIVYFITIFKKLVVHRKSIPPYISFFMLGTLVNSIFIFPYKNAATALVWAAMLYICNSYIKSNDKKQKIAWRQSCQ